MIYNHPIQEKSRQPVLRGLCFRRTAPRFQSSQAGRSDGPLSGSRPPDVFAEERPILVYDGLQVRQLLYKADRMPDRNLESILSRFFRIYRSVWLCIPVSK